MEHRTRRHTGALPLILLGVFAASSALADSGSESNPLKGVTFEALGYVDYSAGQTPLAEGLETDYNRFMLTRGYFTFKKKVNDWMSVRITMDIHQDETGDYKRRDKYYYAELKPPDAGFLTHMTSEIGVGHMPWLDFEEHVNPYRCQGTMPMERAGTFNSADAGVSLRGYFGETIEDAAEKTGNSHYAGRYGSWHLGIYNGGGYHASEANENKVAEGRITIRPLPDIIPGLQFSYLGIFGKGNVAPQSSIPDYQVNLGMVSYEHPQVVATAQVFMTEGNAKGTWVTPEGDALKTLGYSAFGNVKLPGMENRLSAFGRVDYFDSDADDVYSDQTTYTMVIGGVAFSVHKGNLVMLVFETTDYGADFGVGKGRLPVIGAGAGNDQKVQVVYQIKI
jgi:hypothetical protein